MIWPFEKSMMLVFDWYQRRFLNINGGISIDIPRLILWLLRVILSSNRDDQLERLLLCWGNQVFLCEIRPLIKSINEPADLKKQKKLGFSTIFVSKYNKISFEKYVLSKSNLFPN